MRIELYTQKTVEKKYEVIHAFELYFNVLCFFKSIFRTSFTQKCDWIKGHKDLLVLDIGLKM